VSQFGSEGLRAHLATRGMANILQFHSSYTGRSGAPGGIGDHWPCNRIRHNDPPQSLQSQALALKRLPVVRVILLQINNFRAPSRVLDGTVSLLRGWRYGGTDRGPSCRQRDALDSMGTLFAHTGEDSTRQFVVKNCRQTPQIRSLKTALSLVGRAGLEPATNEL
jgi:hypothetical protein